MVNGYEFDGGYPIPSKTPFLSRSTPPAPMSRAGRAEAFDTVAENKKAEHVEAQKERKIVNSLGLLGFLVNLVGLPDYFFSF